MADIRAPPTSTNFMTSGAPSLGGHPDPAVETDHFAVPIGVPAELGHQLSVLEGGAELPREEDRLGQSVALVVGEHPEKGGVEEAGGDGHDPDPDGGQVAGGREGHPDDGT